MAGLVLPTPDGGGAVVAPPTGWGHLAKWDPNAIKRLLANLKGPAAPVAPVRAPVVSPMQDQAAKIAAGIIDPQVAAVNRAIAAKESDRAAAAEAAKGVLAAMHSLGAGAPGAIRDAYSRASTETMGFATGLTGEVGDRAQAAANEVAAKLAAANAPGSVESVAPEAMNTLRYTGGYLPATNLAEEAANRLVEATTSLHAGETSLGQQALTMMNATNAEIAELRAKGLDIENTRPSEAAKALSVLREQDLAERGMRVNESQAEVQSRAEKVQEGALDRSWYQSLSDEAWNRTNATGTMWVVKGDKIVNTGKPAPGSAAGRAVIAANTSTQNTATREANQNARAAAALAEKQAHNRVLEANSTAALGLSAAQLKVAQDREARLGRSKKDGGYSESDKRQYAKQAQSIAEAAIHPKYADDPIISAGDALKKMVANGVPYSIAWRAVNQYAQMEGSPWAVDRNVIKTWFTPNKPKPKPKKK